MSRLSPTVKKRLQANLGQLTAREAGRLLLIYVKEAAKKDNTWGDEYPPIKELWAALKERVDKAKDGPDRERAANVYNGLVFLQRVIAEINFGDFVGLAVAFSSDSYRAMTRIGLLLREDSTSQLIRFAKSDLVSNTPKPVSRDYYKQYQEWLPTQLETFFDAAQYVAEAKVEDGELEEDQENEEHDRVYAFLVAALQAGELQGGDALAHPDIYSPILVEKGKLPAWAALRLLWKPYLVDKGYRIADEATFADWSPDFIDQVYTPAGELVEGDALRRLAVTFYKACRRRPWGKGLIAKPDLDDLVKLLTQSPNPFLHIYPADFGVVDWQTFQKSETNRRTYHTSEEPFELEPAATVASLTAISEKIGTRETFTHEWMEDRYYPTPSPESRRIGLARTLEMMAQLDTTRQPFTYGFLQKSDDERSLSELLGVSFLTPLEEAVAQLRRQNSFAVSVRQALKVISDRYFGGLSLLVSDVDEPLLQGEEYLKIANEALEHWTKRLANWPWQVDTSSLEVGDPEIDEEVVDMIVEKMITEAKRRGTTDDPDAHEKTL